MFLLLILLEWLGYFDANPNTEPTLENALEYYEKADEEGWHFSFFDFKCW